MSSGSQSPVFQSLGELLAVEELTEDDEIVAAHGDLAHASEVRIGERRDAARLATQIDVRASRRTGTLRGSARR